MLKYSDSVSCTSTVEQKQSLWSELNATRKTKDREIKSQQKDNAFFSCMQKNYLQVKKTKSVSNLWAFGRNWSIC